MVSNNANVTISLEGHMEPPLKTRAWMSSPHPRFPIVATASADKSVQLYSLKDRRQIGTISGAHSRSVRSCAWKPSSGVASQPSTLAAGSFDSTVSIWKRPEPEGSAEEIEDHHAQKRRRQDLKEERMGSDGDDDEEDEDDEWQYAVMLEGHESEIKSVAWNSSGQFLATCSRDKSVWIWEDMSYENPEYEDDDTFEVVAVVQKHDADIKAVKWHPTEDLLASGSYDDTIALYREDMDDWTTVATLVGHSGTVWGVDWESGQAPVAKHLERFGSESSVSDEEKKVHLAELGRSGPRLISSSDDRTVRIWQRKPRENRASLGSSTIPTVIRTDSLDEDWLEVARLPEVHTRSIYSVAWSQESGLVATTGGDGMIVLYGERWSMKQPESGPAVPATEWVVLGQIYDAHSVHEVNHITWAPRDGKEVLLSTGDDGKVNMWMVEGDF